MKTYYDVHVFYSRDDGFSVPVATDEPMSDEEVINVALENEDLDSEDAKHVDYVEEIDEDDYNDMKA